MFLPHSQLIEQVNALVTSLEYMINPLLDGSTDLHALYSKCMPILEDTVVITIRNIETIGEKLHIQYVEQRLVKATTAISYTLSKTT